jgi:hypothetical protein
VVWFVLLRRYGGQGAQVQLDAIGTAGTLVIGTGGAVALLLTARRQRYTELALVYTDRDATERRITELYTKGADRLGSDQAPVRLYALERLAHSTVDHCQTIVDVICAYTCPIRRGDPRRAVLGWAPTAAQDPRSDAEPERHGPVAAPHACISRITSSAHPTGRPVRLAAQNILFRNLSCIELIEHYRPPENPRKQGQPRRPQCIVEHVHRELQVHRQNRARWQHRTGGARSTTHPAQPRPQPTIRTRVR